MLVPGNRADLLVTTDRGSSQLRTLPYDSGTMMGMMGAGGSDSSGGGGGMPGMGPAAGDQPATGNSDGTVLATIAVAGRDGTVLPGVPAQPEPRDLRAAAVAARR